MRSSTVSYRCQRIDEIVTARGQEDALIDRLAKIEAGLRIAEKAIQPRKTSFLNVSAILLDLDDPDLSQESISPVAE